MATDFDPSAPYFLDAEEKEVHIGDVVTYSAHSKSGDDMTKCGAVEQITFKGSDTVIVTIKVRGLSRLLYADEVTLVDDETAEGKIRKYTALVSGRIDDDAIADLIATLGLSSDDADGE